MANFPRQVLERWTRRVGTDGRTDLRLDDAALHERFPWLSDVPDTCKPRIVMSTLERLRHIPPGMTAPWSADRALVVDSVTDLLSGQYSSRVVLGLMREFGLDDDETTVPYDLADMREDSKDAAIFKYRQLVHRILEGLVPPERVDAALGYFERDEDGAPGPSFIEVADQIILVIEGVDVPGLTCEGALSRTVA
jgi:hypothetical protein